MDSIELVTTALTAGAAAGARDTASSAVRDAYSALKDLVRRRLAGRQAGEVALVEHEQDPEIWEAPLRAQLRAAGAGDDANVAAAAQALMALLDTSGSRSGRYVINVTGSQGIQVGDSNTQHNNFGSPPPRR
jgi:RIP homotypic interaction motif